MTMSELNPKPQLTKESKKVLRRGGAGWDGLRLELSFVHRGKTAPPRKPMSLANAGR
jgi:hypothetical protein